MKIGILTRKLTSKTDVSLTAIPDTYLDIVRNNAYPVIIDNSLDLEKNKETILNEIIDIDGFILPGGDSISDVDLFIIDYCYQNDIPLLGICLGMQEIAYYFNKKTLSKLNDLSHFDMNAKYLHQVALTKKGYLNKLLKKDIISVNSRHKYHIKENKNYLVEAKSNKIIEAIKVKNKKYILGLQFHIEIMYNYDDNAKLIFNDFFNQLD